MNAEYRTLRLEDGAWRVTLDGEDLPKREAMALSECFTRLGIPYRVARNLVSVPGSVPSERIFPAVEEFYRGRADVVPF